MPRRCTRPHLRDKHAGCSGELFLHRSLSRSHHREVEAEESLEQNTEIAFLIVLEGSQLQFFLYRTEPCLNNCYLFLKKQIHPHFTALKRLVLSRKVRLCNSICVSSETTRLSPYPGIFFPSNIRRWCSVHFAFQSDSVTVAASEVSQFPFYYRKCDYLPACQRETRMINERLFEEWDTKPVFEMSQ